MAGETTVDAAGPVAAETSAAAGEAATRRRGRDPEGSRAAVLDAGERLFAEHGFGGATMQEIGEAAGLSRGAPAYIFGDKRSLYRAVIERVFEDRHHALAPAFEAVAGLLEGGADGRGGRGVQAGDARGVGQAASREAASDAAEGALLPAITAYLEFLAERPAFVRLMQWEALHGGEGLSSIPHRSSAIGEALGAAAARGEGASAGSGEDEGEGAEAEAKQLVLSCVALCFFPFEHGATMLPALGMDPMDPDFRRERAQHVARLLAAAITGPPPPRRSRREEQR